MMIEYVQKVYGAITGFIIRLWLITMLLQIFFNKHCSSPIGNKNPYILQFNGGTDTDYYRNFLLSVSKNVKSQEYIWYQSKSGYNIFHIWGVTEKEVIMCRFLADLLNSEGQHGCGILFLACLPDKVWKCPSAYSRKEKSGTDILPIDRIQCISWAEDICGWLNKLTAQLTKPVKSTVMQYIDAIHVVADERDRKMMEKIENII